MTVAVRTEGKVKCPNNRGGRANSATSACWCLEPPLIKRAGPKDCLSSCPNKDTIVPCSPPLWNVERTAVSLILPWWWWWGGTPVLLMRFFSRSAIYIWDRHPLPTPHLAIEPVELMQEGVGGVAKRENNPTVSPNPPTTITAQAPTYSPSSHC